MRKKFYILILAILLSASNFAQSPEKISYQAIVRDSGGNLVSKKLIGMQISILQGSVSGTVVFVQTQTPTSNANGLVTLEIDNFDIDWSTGPYFIKTETDPLGGSSYSITGTSQLLSVPYALYANKIGDSVPSGGLEGQVLAINSSGVPEWTFAVAGCSVWYLDADGDNYAVSTLTQCTSPGAGYTTTVLPLGDCNDNDATINPQAYEISGDGIDNDCDGQIDGPANIGDYRDAGVVFWVDPIDETHGLVCAIKGQTLSRFYGNYYVNPLTTDIPPNGSAIGTGETNTQGIYNIYNSVDYGTFISSAALTAREYLVGGTGWFLPSKDELAQMYLHKSIINIISSENGGYDFGIAINNGNIFYEWNYWSSTSEGFSGLDRYASSQNFYDGSQTSSLTNAGLNVRAVRAF